MKRKKSKATTRKIIAITQISLDGVMQAPGGPEEDPRNGFNLGGWAMHFPDKIMKQVVHESISGKFDLLLGRRTYDIFAGYWPHQGDHPIAKAFNQATKYVVTRGRKPLNWETSVRLGDNIVAELRWLKASKGPPLIIWGSSNLLQTLIAANLIDEHRLWVVPVILGKGKRLFENSVPPRTFKLVKTLTTTKGVLINTYRPDGPVKTG